MQKKNNNILFIDVTTATVLYFVYDIKILCKVCLVIIYSEEGRASNYEVLVGVFLCRHLYCHHYCGLTDKKAKFRNVGINKEQVDFIFRR